MKRILALQILWTVLSVSLLGGCGGPVDIADDFQNEDPKVRISAIKRAGQEKLESATPYLIDRLTDSEAEVRMFAILALQEITGLTHDYRYYDGADLRNQAVARWRKWFADKRRKSAAQPADERKAG